MDNATDKYIPTLGFKNKLPVDNVGGSLFGCFMLGPEHAADSPSTDESNHRPIRLDAGAMCICLRGTGRTVINGISYEAKRGDMVIVFPRAIIQDTANDADFLGYAVAINTEFMASIKVRSLMQSYVSLRENPVLHLDDEEISTIVELCELLKAKDKRADHYYRNEINRALLTVLSYEIHNICLHQHAQQNVPRSRQDAIFQEFLDLVEKNFSVKREIGYYAGRLCITPKYLSVVVKNISGVNPTEWINRAVLLNAKTLLTTTDLTVQQISAELNFPNPSFFGQYFKRNTGITPKKYRTQAKR